MVNVVTHSDPALSSRIVVSKRDGGVVILARIALPARVAETGETVSSWEGRGVGHRRDDQMKC